MRYCTFLLSKLFVIRVTTDMAKRCIAKLLLWIISQFMIKAGRSFRIDVRYFEITPSYATKTLMMNNSRS